MTANAHAMLASYSKLKSPTLRSATLAKAANTVGSDGAPVANAHAELAIASALNSPTQRSAALAKAANTGASE